MESAAGARQVSLQTQTSQPRKEFSRLKTFLPCSFFAEPPPQQPAPAPAPAPAPVGGAAIGQAVKWARPLSCDRLTLGDGDATATKAWSGEPYYPAALVAVSRGGGAEGFALAAVVEALPAVSNVLSFGVGRAMPKEGKVFGNGTYGADGTCGLAQHAGVESIRYTATEGFGRRADRDDIKLG
eukprot:COSAG04_NODE_3746_length_2561_cov_4.391552_1_plen_182_part_10